ncbi:type II toxin-antitoxin system RelE/ParE family toxin [Martelella lutilitoris]|uniref:type II toxin-antitoxin system RelE/ParE family toxin n=1 Tax=Martelella lutilitoris TaxID=2583532 RepID=UPI003CCC5F48
MAKWKVAFRDRFKGEITDLPADVRVELLAHLVPLREKRFRLGRPEVDTLEGPKHAKMKEPRVKALKVQWRLAFAFDPERKAISPLWRCKERCEPETLLQAPDRSGGQAVR